MRKFNYLIFQRKNKLCTSLWFILLILVTSFTMQGQNLKGRITADTGEPLAGVSIKVKNTNVGTVTNDKGEYSLTVTKNATLVISFVGYIPQESNVSGQSVQDFVLKSENRELGEVIVVGYGTQKKRDITGSVVSVSEATLKEVPTPNLLNSLKGRAAGVSIVSNGSTPNVV